MTDGQKTQEWRDGMREHPEPASTAYAPPVGWSAYDPNLDWIPGVEDGLDHSDDDDDLVDSGTRYGAVPGPTVTAEDIREVREEWAGLGED